MRIEPLQPGDVPAFAEQARSRYADQLRTTGLTPQEADNRADADTRALIPHGALRPGHAILAARTDDGPDIGQVWIGPHPTIPDTAFIYDLVIDAAHRRHGHGEALMTAAEDWAQRHDMHSVTLNVVAGNTAARSLYLRLGYTATNITMRRRLTTGDASEH